MKYLKKFEREIANDSLRDALEYFFSQHNIFKSKYDNALNRAKSNNIPEFLYDEFSILFFLYECRGWWSNRYNDTILNFIKKEIKSQTLNSIINKFEEDPDKYFILKDIFDKNPKWNDVRSLHGVSGGTVKYIFMLFYKAIKDAPQWIKDSNKFNL